MNEKTYSKKDHWNHLWKYIPLVDYLVENWYLHFPIFPFKDVAFFSLLISFMSFREKKNLHVVAKILTPCATDAK